jgi:hypothetical protein
VSDEAQRRVPHVREAAVAGDVALVGGYSAWFLGRVLQTFPGGGIESLVARAGVPPGRQNDVLRAVAALVHVGAEWWLATGRGSVSASGSEVDDRGEAPVRSTLHGSSFLSAQDAARVLGLTDRRVRMLADKGLLRGRRDPGGRWQFDPAAVMAERDRRMGARVKGRAA